MKLGTLRFNPKHRAARSARASRTTRLAEAQAVSAMLNSVSLEALAMMNQTHGEIAEILRGGVVLTDAGALPPTTGIGLEAQFLHRRIRITP